MLTEEDYCDYDTCVALIKLGYNRKSNQFYIERKDPKVRRLLNWGMLSAKDFIEEHGWLLAINLYEAKKWLRKEKDIHIEIPRWLTNDGVWKYSFRLQTREFYDRATGEWDTYEEALLEGIKEAAKVLKENETIHE